MTIWGNIVKRLRKWPTVRKWIIGSLAILALVAVVFFSDDVQYLWRWLRGQAAEELWTTHSESVKKETMHGKTIVVDHPNGKRYLYTIGGAEFYQSDIETRLRLLDNVQRIELDENGKIKESVQWEGDSIARPSPDPKPWMHMYSGHAEFGVYYLHLSDKHWLYVVSGDIHIPDIDDTEIANPLLFSTIEKLDLDSESAGWSPVAIVTGVNFYPEVIEFGNKFHIVGGVYGNPFGKYTSTTHKWYNNYYDYKDPLLPTDDVMKWNDPIRGYDQLRRQDNWKRTLGSVGVSVKDGGLGDDIFMGGAGPGQGDVLGLGLKINLADYLSKALLNGSFATTVSEHYAITLTDFTNQHIGELGNVADSNNDPKNIEDGGNDYQGKLISTWEEYNAGGRVTHLGHLRIGITSLFYGDPPQTYLYVYPVPQGRYGHKLIEAGSAQNLYVLGGAAWSTKIILSNSGVTYDTEISPFWVLEDDFDPIGRALLGISWHYNDPDAYRFVGNISYQWYPGDQVWGGTNLTQTAGVATKFFDLSKFAPLSGAFFSLAKLAPESGVTEWLAVGGLANDNSPPWWQDSHPSYDTVYYWPTLRKNDQNKWGISVKVTNRSERYSSTAKEWQQTDPSADAPGYNFGANAAGMGGYAVVLGGQSTFQGQIEGSDAPFNDDHVPDLADIIATQTHRYVTSAGGGGSWSKLGDFNIDTVFYPFGNVLSEAGAGSGKTIYLYKISGSFGTAGNLSPGVEWLGPFTYGMPGVVDPAHSTIVIDPLRDSYTKVDIDGVDTDVPTVWNDHYDYATATITLKDYYGTPVTSGGDNTIAVSLYTSRSSAPAINKYGAPSYYRDDIRMIGTAYSGTVPTGWTNQLVEVDGNGQATFRMLSGFATDADTGQPIYEDVRGYVYIDNVGAGAAQQINGVGWASLIFTREGHPVAVNSNLTADPYTVKADDIDTSLLEATVKDYKNLPIPGFTVSLTSNRNYFDPGAPPDHFTPSNLPVAQLVTDEKGEAETTVKSAEHGASIIYGYYTIPNYETLPNAPDLLPYCGYKSTRVKFTLVGNKILSLSPSSGKQGQSLPGSLEAVGEYTVWKTTDTNNNYNTKVSFLEPSHRFSTSDPKQDINTLHLPADGKSFTQFIVDTNTANEAVTIEILEGGGCLFPSSDIGGCESSKTIYANANKQATFTYEASDTAGILKIKATFSNNSTSQLWLPLVEAGGVYEMELVADPGILQGTASSSQIFAFPTNFGGAIPPAYVTEWSYFTDDPTGNLQKINQGAGDIAFLTLLYTQADYKSVAHIFVVGVYGGKKIIGMVPVYRQQVIGDANNIIFDNHDATGQPKNLTVEDVSGKPDQQKLIAPDSITVGASARVGLWTFCVTTFSEADDTLYTETAPFVVFPSDYGDQAIIVRLEPNQGLRGQQDLRVGIIGLGTNFVDYTGDTQSVVTFTPFKPENGGDTGGVTATVVTGASGNGLEYLTVDIDITEKATMGYWNVQVVSGGGLTNPNKETATGTRLFFVTTSSGYFIDLTAVPNSLPRDGYSPSVLTAKVGQINQVDGSIVNQNNKLVIFIFLPTDPDNGYLDPGFDYTSSGGIATNAYYSDLGIKDDTDTVEAAAKISDTLTVYGTVVITKIGVGEPDKPNGLKSDITAQSPVQIDPDGGEPCADGDPCSEVTVTVRNSSGVPLGGKQVTLASDRPTPPDHIKPTPSYLTTNDQGEVVYRVSSGQAGFSTVTATITEGAIQLSYEIEFKAEGVLVPRVFKVTVPFQARDYDNRVLVVIKDNDWNSNGDTDLEKEYTKNARNAASQPNYLPGLYTEGTGPVFWLYPNRTFTVWVKGKQHLAAANPNGVINSGTSLQKEDIVVDFTTVNGGRGLLAGDIVTASGVSEVYPGYHDNVVSKLAPLADDLKLLMDSWFKITDIYLPDINFDGIVNSIDVLYGLANLGNGALKP